MVTDALYHKHGGETNREDLGVYRVLVYLALIRIDELTWAQFRRFVDAYDDIKMVRAYTRVLCASWGAYACQ